jgi:crotonobetainyl-CoA:carnitine CoA-transferase CaiB-like acyl-CoA transferase
MGAYAVALALLHRQRTGEGRHVDTALAYTAMIHQSPFMQVYAGKRWDEPGCREPPSASGNRPSGPARTRPMSSAKSAWGTALQH